MLCFLWSQVSPYTGGTEVRVLQLLSDSTGYVIVWFCSEQKLVALRLVVLSYVLWSCNVFSHAQYTHRCLWSAGGATQATLGEGCSRKGGQEGSL